MRGVMRFSRFSIGVGAHTLTAHHCASRLLLVIPYYSWPMAPSYLSDENTPTHGFAFGVAIAGEGLTRLECRTYLNHLVVFYKMLRKWVHHLLYWSVHNCSTCTSDT